MVKAAKSMFNFDNASWIFVGAVVIILIILALFYFRRSKNVESFAEDWETEFKKGISDYKQCALDQKDKSIQYISRDNKNASFCLPRCLSDDDCPEIPNNNGELERIKCTRNNADKNILGSCLIHPKLSNKPVITASGCHGDFTCAKGYKCDGFATDPNPEKWTAQCYKDNRDECVNDTQCDKNNVCQQDGTSSRCNKFCEDDKDCDINDYVCKGANKEKNIKGTCSDKRYMVGPKDTCFFSSDSTSPKDSCFSGYKCDKGNCVKDEPAGSSKHSKTAPKKPTSGKAPVKKAPVKKVPVKKAPVKKAPVKKASVRESFYGGCYY